MSDSLDRRGAPAPVLPQSTRRRFFVLVALLSALPFLATGCSTSSEALPIALKLGKNLLDTAMAN